MLKQSLKIIIEVRDAALGGVVAYSLNSGLTLSLDLNNVRNTERMEWHEKARNA